MQTPNPLPPANESPAQSILDQSPIHVAPFIEGVLGFLQRSHFTGGDVPAYNELMLIFERVAKGEYRFIDANQEAQLRGMEHQLQVIGADNSQVMEAFKASAEIRDMVKAFHQAKLDAQSSADEVLPPSPPPPRQTPSAV